MRTVSKTTRSRMSASAKRRCTPEWREAMSKRLRTELPVKQVEKMYAGGMSQDELAAHFGVSQKVIWGFMRRNKLKTRKQVKRNQWGPNNDSWKGDDAGYSAMHLRLTKKYGQPKRCEACGTTDERRSYNWASLNKRYHDMSDYRRMCRSCHATYDGVINNIAKMRERKAARGKQD